MKKLLLSLPLLTLTSLGVQAQGYLFAANVTQDLLVEKRISDRHTGDYLTSVFQAQLFIGVNGALESVLTAIDSPVQFLDSPPESQGDFLGNSIAVNGYNPGDTITVQVRAWPTVYTTWLQAYNAALSDATIHVGTSTTFTLVLGTSLDPAEMAPSMPLFSVGIIPEPSMIGLGALGLGTMFFRRRQA